MALDRKQQYMKEEWSKAQFGNLFGVGEGSMGANVIWCEDEKISLPFDFFAQSLTIAALKDQLKRATGAFQNTNPAVRDAEALLSRPRDDRQERRREEL